MTEPESEITGKDREEDSEPRTFGDHLRDVTDAARLERAQSSFSRGAPALEPTGDKLASDALFGDSPTAKKTLKVCWQCEKAWSEEEWSYCPLCSADLVEVEKE